MPNNPAQLISNIPDPFRAPVPSVLALMALSLGTIGNVTAQDAEFMAVSKTQNFQQISAHIVALVDEDSGDSGEAPLVFEAIAFASAPNLLTSGFLRRPTGPDVTLALGDDGNELLYEEGFTTPIEMNNAFADGSYTLNLVGANDGPKAVVLDLSGDAYAGLTRFTMFESAQSIDASGAMSFQWSPIQNGTVDDLVFLSIEDESGEVLFETPDIGEPGALDGTSTSVSVPGGTLDPGTEYDAYLDVYRAVDSDESYVVAFGAYGKSVRMPIRTTGAGPVTIPNLVRSIPGDFWQDVELNTIVTFVFDEPMDPTVPVGQAVNWTGVADADQFSYRWSPDAKTLFCNYTPGLPVSATIGWTLNPAGSTAKLRNAAENNLPDDIPGSFTTSDTSNLGVSDVASFSLIKAKFFYQSGATPVDTGSYFAEFFAELNGTSTVSSVDLAIPGVGTATDLGELMYDFDELEGCVDYAEKADMDRIFPNGSYQVTLHTFHDGDQSLTLDLGPDSYPNAPAIQNFAATQAWDGSQAFTLEWSAMTGGTSNDLILVTVEGDTACFFDSPDVGAPGALDGTATSVTLPANTLPPGRTLEGELVFAKIIDNDTSQYPGARGLTAFVTITEFTIQTTGTPFVPRLAVSHNGAQAKVTVTAERGRAYEISSSENLQTWTPVWTEWLSDDCNAYRGTFDYFDNVAGIPARYYQVRELPLGP